MPPTDLLPPDRIFARSARETLGFRAKLSRIVRVTRRSGNAYEAAEANRRTIRTEHLFSGAAIAAALSYKVQERVIGGLSAATRHLLCGEEPAPVRRRRGLRPGTVLIREWARHRPSDHDCRARGDLSRRTPPLAVRGCAPDHRRPLVGAAGLRREAMTAKPPARRCAVYARKSSEEGLEQDAMRWITGAGAARCYGCASGWRSSSCRLLRKGRCIRTGVNAFLAIRQLGSTRFAGSGSGGGFGL